jgi:lactoylglutathione lyase
MLRTGPISCALSLALFGCAADLEPVVEPVVAGAHSNVAEPPSPVESTTVQPAEIEVAAVDHVGLAVKDLEASAAFFVEGLGYAVRGKDPSYPAAFLSNGRSLITLWQVAEPDSAVDFDRRQNVGLHHLALSVTSFEALDALHDRLAKMPGVRIEFAPELSYGGPAKHMMVYEPSGNRIELVHRPG